MSSVVRAPLPSAIHLPHDIIRHILCFTTPICRAHDCQRFLVTVEECGEGNLQVWECTAWRDPHQRSLNGPIYTYCQFPRIYLRCFGSVGTYSVGFCTVPDASSSSSSSSSSSASSS